MPKRDGDPDLAYDYEATQTDIRAFSDFKDTGFTREEFERIVNALERANVGCEDVRPLSSLLPAADIAAHTPAAVNRIYEVPFTLPPLP